VEEVQAGIEQRRRDRPAVDEHVRLDEVPAARPHDERRHPVGQLV
jgi:hypothetical protein